MTVKQLDTTAKDYNDENALAQAEEGAIEEFVVSLKEDGTRIDKLLAMKLPQVSRSRIKTLIEEGAVQINGQLCDSPKRKAAFSDVISIQLRPRLQDKAFKATPMALDVVYEDEDILVVNKPAGLVVHPAAGHWDDTLLNGLLSYSPVFATLPRAGIVHRLDRDTSGLMVVAKNEAAQMDLVRQLQERTVKREYWLLTRGRVPEDKVIDAAIERDPRNPLRFCTGSSARAKPALTRVRRIDIKEVAGKVFSWAAARLSTGRTHQIRVHMESIGLPLIGDPLYRSRLPQPKDDGTVLGGFRRQALHASRLGLLHPATGEMMEWFVEPPQDFRALMDELGFAPWDKPSEVFDEPLPEADFRNEIGTIGSWDDFDFGDEEDEDDCCVQRLRD